MEVEIEQDYLQSYFLSVYKVQHQIKYIKLFSSFTNIVRRCKSESLSHTHTHGKAGRLTDA